MTSVIFQDWGCNVSYHTAWSNQEKLLKENGNLKFNNRQLLQQNLIPEYLPKNYFILLEHNPVITLGRSGKINNLITSPEVLSQLGIEFVLSDRGGDITFHGPGQIVGYPILDLEQFKTDLGWYVRMLEEVIIETLKEFYINATRSKGETGVWLDPQDPHKARKIAAIGVRCSRWITMHGFAFNVNNKLNYFDHIVPCGIQNKKVTSLEKELSTFIDINLVKTKIICNFEKVFNVQLIN
ncbi:MAG: lipoyl(octanoyl) transferase LipB [Sediminibacterium sp.]|nr:lipoyl(octanoyl) transferase LipB [Sediminibacterium sp.]